MGNNDIKFTDKPELRQPNLVCGFSGWVDGGEAATGTIEYLANKLNSKKFAEIAIENFRIFQIPGEDLLRPEIKIENGILKEHQFPTSEFYYSKTKGENDLILLSGIEPNLNWLRYAQIIVDIVNEFAVKRIYLLGGVLGSIPYTKEPNVSCVCNPPVILEEMKKYKMQLSSYEGPGSFGTTLISKCQKENIHVVSLMAVALYYPKYNITVVHNPNSIRAIVKRLKGILNLDLDIADLDNDVVDLEGKLDFIANQNQEFKDYAAKLENEYTELKYEEPLEITGEEGIKIAEDLLKKKEP